MHLADRILMQEQGVVVVDKPVGWPSTGRTLDDPHCIQWLLMQHLRRSKVWAVHQLDKDTSGLNVFVLRKALVEHWGQRLKAGTKAYLAIVQGQWTRGRTTIEAPIGRTNGQPCIHSEGRAAKSRVVPLRVGKSSSLLSVTLKTGRTHQVRLHMAHVGHPLLGESRYIDGPCRRAPRQALHAHTLKFRTDADGPRRLWAPLPPDLQEVLLREGILWSDPNAQTS